MGKKSIQNAPSRTTNPVSEAENQGYRETLSLNKSGDFFCPTLPHIQIDKYSICDMIMYEAMRATLYLLSIYSGEGELCAYYISYWE